MYTFTIFTPCYNGANTIHRVFESVESQIFRDFEWIIINDGSLDDSDNVIKELIVKSSVKDRIIYLSQNNQGKHIIWNQAVKMAKGKWFVPADCDDSFKPETLDFFANKIKNYRGGDMLSGINVCCYNPENNNLVGTPYPQDNLCTNNIELQYKYKILGEHWGVVSVDAMRLIRFPEIKGHYFTENYMWFSLAARGYQVLCFNEMLRAYYYNETSLTNNPRYVFDRNKIFMYICFHWWCVSSKVGVLVAKCSLPGYLKMWMNLFKQCIKYVLSCMKSKSGE